MLLGVLLGLVLGKPLGVLGFCFLAVRARVVTLPAGVGWREVLVVGLLAGIGFTMALFIANLAFPGDPRLEVAKLGVLGASAAAGVLGLIAVRALLSRGRAEEGAATEAGAESSTQV